MMPPTLPFIGVFDSGVGGLTVLRALHAQLPDAPLAYVADSAHAPYGGREPGYIVERSLRIGEHLLRQGATMLVVACNTATVHAVQALRQQWPGLPVVAIEPGIKPAVAASSAKRVGVLATRATLASARYQDLLHAHAGDCTVVSQACPGLVELIEAGDMEAPALRELIAKYCEPLTAAEVDTVLLGCTHYPFVQRQIEQQLGPRVRVLNIEDAVARQAARLWPQARELAPWMEYGAMAHAAGPISLASTGDPTLLERMALLALPHPPKALAVRI